MAPNERWTSDGTYLTDNGSRLTETRRTNHGLEDVCQHQVGEHPVLLRLAGGLLLIRRQHAVLDRQSGADRIPKDLAWIAEFLNKQMLSAKVLALEIDPFTDATVLRTIVPRLLAAAEQACTTKAVTPPAGRLSRTDWLEDLAGRFGRKALKSAQRGMLWFREHHFEVAVG